MKYYKVKPSDYYNHTRANLLELIINTPKTALDVGCGEGSFAVLVKEKYKAETWGIEYVAEQAAKAGKKLDKAFAGPCEEHIPNLPDNYFDVIFFNDVLEHLVDPYSVLEDIRSKLAPGGIVIASIPNVRYYKNMANLLFTKDWKYQSHGIMDKTHLRFFTKKSMIRMFDEAGYECKKVVGLGKSRSLKYIPFALLTLFTQGDARYGGYGIVATSK